MAYTPITNFAAKDALPAGNPAKKIRGSDFAAEFSAIQTDSATNVKHVSGVTTIGTGGNDFNVTDVYIHGSTRVGYGPRFILKNDNEFLGMITTSDTLGIDSNKYLTISTDAIPGNPIIIAPGNNEVMRISLSGAVVKLGSLGYGTGSGGAVTQTTSRTTGVTINKTNGAITLFTAAGSTTATSFVVTNNTVVATDTINLSVKSGTNKYVAFVTAVSSGSFEITFYTTGGTSSDAPVINFAVLKAVTA